MSKPWNLKWEEGLAMSWNEAIVDGCLDCQITPTVS